MVACLLMAFTEALQQRSDRGYMHLQGALAVMAARAKGNLKGPVDNDVLSTLFEKLNLHSATYALSFPIPTSALSEDARLISMTPDRALYRILHSCYRFISTALPLKYVHPL
jgi:hypothetical protein